MFIFGRIVYVELCVGDILLCFVILVWVGFFWVRDSMCFCGLIFRFVNWWFFFLI
jgi:hypothetical protein